MGRILSAAMLGHKPDPLQHYSALAHESQLLLALREACAEIEKWAGHAFRVAGQSQAEFERAWRDESATDEAHYDKWCELKTVAGLALTDLSTEPLECDA